MGMRTRKAAVRELLLQRDRNSVLKWADSVRNPIKTLISLTYDEDELVRWRAIEAVGWTVALYAESDLERVRDTIRSLLWLMNDESGGVGWHAPELIGEILVNVPVLISEYAGFLPSFFREEPFERGTHFAVYRVASVDPRPFADSVPDLVDSLNDPDPAIRAYAALALKAIGGSSMGDDTNKLQADKAEFLLYDFDTGQLNEVTRDRMLEEASRESGSLNQEQEHTLLV